MKNSVFLPDSEFLSIQEICDGIANALFPIPEKSEFRILYKQIRSSENNSLLELDLANKITLKDFRKLKLAWTNLRNLECTFYDLEVGEVPSENSIVEIKDLLSKEEYESYRKITDAWSENWQPYATFDANKINAMAEQCTVHDRHVPILKKYIANSHCQVIDEYHAEIDLKYLEQEFVENIFIHKSEALSYIEINGLNVAKETTVDTEKPLGNRERDTLLTIIAALCKEAKIPYDKPAKAAGMIQSTAVKMGVSIGETTIEGHLKKIPDALATRMK